MPCLKRLAQVVSLWLLCALLLPATLPAAGQTVALAPGGPWLVYEIPAGLVAANPDGSGRTLLVPRPTPDSLFIVEPAPTGDRFALAVIQPGGPSRWAEAAAELRLIQLPGGVGRTIRPSLLPEGASRAASYALVVPGLIETLQRRGLAWSPGGDRLAYASAHEGQPALYLYTAASGTSQRLTDDGGLPGELSWSAHGRHLVWTSQPVVGRPVLMATSFASASGRVAGSPPAPLESGLPAGTQTVSLGWITPDRLLLSGVQPSGDGPLHGLADYDFGTRTATTLLADLSITAAAASPQMALFGAAGTSGLPPGLYRFDLATRRRAFVSPEVPVDLHYVRERDLFLVTLAGANLLLPANATQASFSQPEGIPLPAPTGPAIAYRQSDQLLVAPALDAVPFGVPVDPASTLAWSADGNTLYILGASGLLAVQPTSGSIVTLDPEAVPDALAGLMSRALTILADRAVELREQPADDAVLLATLAGDEPVSALLGRNRAGDWVKVQLGDGREGWLRTAALTTSLIPTELPILRD